MRAEDLFKPELGILTIAEDMNQAIQVKTNAEKFKDWLYAFFKDDEIAKADPTQAVDLALKLLLDPTKPMGEFARKNRLNAVLMGARQAEIPVNHTLRQHVEKAINEAPTYSKYIKEFPL